ncbi:putative endonuclease [Parelusimicrobium proximum]|uniref:YraN family protein n=1 Tax=Parelusimicrobium proximum TaxID=3228953 RepID=UPI003D1661CD
MIFNRKQKGMLGEERAADYLKKKKYKIAARNYVCPAGELDIVAWDGRTLVFVEVKERAGSGYGGAVGAVTKAKQTRVHKAAVSYIKYKSPSYEAIRFDIVVIEAGEIEHIPNAFVPKWSTM